jgi:polyhydroxybutyrate depolymerase
MARPMLCSMRTRAISVFLATTAVALGVVAGPAAGTTTTTPTRTGCGRSATPGTTTRHLTVGGADRQYLLTIPDGYDGSKRAPLLFDFHGLGSDEEQQAAYSQLGAKAGARGYVVITPDGQGTVARHWSLVRPAKANPDIEFVPAMLGATQRTLCIDPTRIYATGISNGAMFSTVLACALPGRLAAIAPVSGVNGAPVCRAGTPRVSVLAFHSTADPLVPYLGGDYFSGAEASHEAALQAQPVDAAVGRWAAFDGCGAPASTTAVADDVQRITYPNCPPNGTVELYRVIGGGHTWPGAIPVRADRLGATTESIDASALMLDFFAGHPRPS